MLSLSSGCVNLTTSCCLRRETLFLFAGITPKNELRDPPKYIRSVFSQPIDDETFYTEYNKEFGPEESETKCFQIWTKTKKKISKGKFQCGFFLFMEMRGKRGGCQLSYLLEMR